METKFIFLFFLVSILCINKIDASLNLNQAKLEFNIQKGENMCQNIQVSSSDYTGVISIRDIWPQQGEENSGFSKYTLNASDYGININYNNKITNLNGESEVQVCLSGEKVGNFRGALIFTPKSTDTNVVNTVIEMGAWLFVNVNGNSVQPVINNTSSVNKTESKLTAETTVSNTNADSQVVYQTNETQGGSSITGNVIGDTIAKNLGSILIIAGVVVGLAIIIAGVKIYNKTKDPFRV